MVVELLIVLALILRNGFFPRTELAVVAAPRTQLKARRTTGSRGASAALSLADAQPARRIRPRPGRR